MSGSCRGLLRAEDRHDNSRMLSTTEEPSPPEEASPPEVVTAAPAASAEPSEATGGADAVLAASIFHFGQHTVPEAKRYMAEHGIIVRL